MKVIQALARYFPDPCGGIQVNLNDLIPQLKSKGLEIKIAAANNGAQTDKTYEYNGVEVYRYPIFPKPATQPNQTVVPHGQFANFAHWLADQKADIYHQHHWEVYCGLHHLKLAKELGMSTVVTVHYPIPICQRTTLMFKGQKACDGKIDLVRCSQCADGLSNKLPVPIVKTLSQLPISLISRLPLPESAYLSDDSNASNLGKLVRPFVIPGYVKSRQASLQAMAKFADRIITVCDWLYQGLLINGIPQEKLVLGRCGIADIQSHHIPPTTMDSEPLKVVFLGRWDIYKGIDILVKAIKILSPEIPIQLIIHGITQDERYRQKILKLIADDPRIIIGKQLARNELPSVLAQYDVMAVPSQWLETGPLVVLEAQALSLPVVGSNLGGIAELVQHEINGLLVTPDDPHAWAQAFKNLATERDLVQKLRQGIKPVRTVSTQSDELVALYNQLYWQHRDQ